MFERLDRFLLVRVPQPGGVVTAPCEDARLIAAEQRTADGGVMFPTAEFDRQWTSATPAYEDRLHFSTYRCR